MASNVMSVAERRDRERKGRFLSLILSLILPGLGQLVGRRIGIGIAALILDAGFVLFPLTMIRTVVIRNELTNLTWLIWLLWAVTFGFYYLLVAYDAYRGTWLQTAPCRRDCPAEINVSDYVALVAAGRYAEALELIRERAPLAATLGRICPAPCEEVCTRTRIEEPVAIRALKRSAAEHELPAVKFTLRHPQKVAVVGAGASGLSCTYFLAKRGYSVDIFDREDQPGGLLSAAIPCFRLPRQALKEDLDFILFSSDGIRFIGRKELGANLDLAELERTYDAVYLALGAAKPRPLMIAGEDLKGVIQGLVFLRDVCTGSADYSFSGHVVVLGGGNTAVDSARTALRLGAKKVTLFYRRIREYMPAYAGEVAEAEREGVRLEFLAAPLEFKGTRGVQHVRLGRMRLRDHSSGRRSELEAVEGEEWEEEVEAVIVAVGQEADYAVFEELTLASDAEGKIKVNPRHLRTNRHKVFAGGDAVRGPASVVEAVADGRKAAQSIDLFLRPRFLGRFFERIADFDPDFGLERLEGAAWTEKKPVVKSRVKEQTNYKNPGLYVETMCGLARESDQEEAKRCLRCQRYNVGFAYKTGKQKGYLSLDER